MIVHALLSAVRTLSDNGEERDDLLFQMREDDCYHPFALARRCPGRPDSIILECHCVITVWRNRHSVLVVGSEVDDWRRRVWHPRSRIRDVYGAMLDGVCHRVRGGDGVVIDADLEWALPRLRPLVSGSIDDTFDIYEGRGWV